MLLEIILRVYSTLICALLPLICVFFTHLSPLKADCGRPGYSKESMYIEQTHRYHEDQLINYKCKSKDSLLYGHKERHCEDGRWSDYIPKCGSKVPTGLVQLFVKPDLIAVYTSPATKLVGVRIRFIFDDEDELKDVKVENLENPKCDLQTETRTHPLRKRIFSVTCATMNVKSTLIQTLHLIVLKFKQVVNESNVLSYELFAVDKDDCNVPDQPLYGRSIEVFSYDGDTSHFDSNNTVTKKSSYRRLHTCNPHFYFVDTQTTYEDICLSGEDWKYPALPHCWPNVTCSLPLVGNNVLVSYLDIYADDNYVVGGTIHYTCLENDTLVGSESQICLPDGTWSKTSPPKCVSKSQALELFMYRSLAGFGVTASMIAVIVVCCYKRKRRKTAKDEAQSMNGISENSVSFIRKFQDRSLPSLPKAQDFILDQKNPAYDKTSDDCDDDHYYSTITLPNENS